MRGVASQYGDHNFGLHEGRFGSDAFLRQRHQLRTACWQHSGRKHDEEADTNRSDRRHRSRIAPICQPELGRDSLCATVGGKEVDGEGRKRRHMGKV